MGSGPGSPFGLLEDKAPEPPGCLIFGGFTDSPHPHKQETGGLDTIQATVISFLGGYFSSFKKICRQRQISKKNPEIRKNLAKSQACNIQKKNNNYNEWKI